MIDEFDFKKLNTMTAFLKAESESFSEDTTRYIECLILRYDLVAAIPDELKIEEIPDEIIDTIRNGFIPTKEDLLPLDKNAQAYLITQLVWLCGMHRIIYYSSLSAQDDHYSKAEDLIKMQESSGSHVFASYIYAALALLNCRIVSDEYIASLTNNFDNSEENILKLNRIFAELCESIYLRYHEDFQYYEFIENE
jgi:hypothetical protein